LLSVSYSNQVPERWRQESLSAQEGREANHGSSLR